MPRYSPQQETEWLSFQQKLSQWTDDELFRQCKHYIWLSAYAHNNPNSNYHRMVDACYAECATVRQKPDIYQRAYDETYRENFGER